MEEPLREWAIEAGHPDIFNSESMQAQGNRTAEGQRQSKASIGELGIQAQETPVRPGSLLEKAQEVSGEFIVRFYRQLGAYNKCPPTTNTSDGKIVEIYSLVGSAFQAAAKRRGERVPAVFLNRIVSGFLQIYEGKARILCGNICMTR